MSEEKLKFLGTWKGRIIKAIAVDGAQTWKELRDLTGLSPKSINRTLAELMNSNVIEKKKVDDKETIYRVSYNIYKDYQNYYNSKPDQKEKKQVSINQETQKEIVQWIGSWKELNQKQIDLAPKHFFLEGMDLDEFSKKIIKQVCKKEVIVVNPFVDKIDISVTLIDAVKRGINTTLITRPPSNTSHNYESIKDFHSKLKDTGISVIYDNTVHAKIIVADRAVAIVSSMNFNTTSSAGKSWEAGLVTIEPRVIESVQEGIIKLQDLI